MSLHFLIIDDDKSSIEIYRSLLEKAGHTVSALTSNEHALEQIMTIQPDCVLCDLMLPDLDSLMLFQQLRAKKNIRQPVFIIITSKQFVGDRQQAFDIGVDGYLTKPIDPEAFVDNVLEIALGRMVVEFWGIRGTLPVPGEKTVHYGGNTNCVSLSIAKKNFFIFDAGTGIKELSNHLTKKNVLPFSAKIFISHPHYDHINGFPFFVPLFIKGNEFEVFGTNQGKQDIEALMSNLMDCVYLPFSIKEFSAKLKFHHIDEGNFSIENIDIQTMLLNHPGRCLGYRVEYKGKVFCYVTDNELFFENSPCYNQFEVDRLMKLIKEADVLVIDATYTDEEYIHKVGWGHSAVSRVIDVADQARVKLLCLYHHDPEQYDQEIEAKLKQARALLKTRHSATRCIAPREGEKIVI